jgi:hypothetical protein
MNQNNTTCLHKQSTQSYTKIMLKQIKIYTIKINIKIYKYLII